MTKKGKICIFGASSGRIESTYTDEAYKLGTLMAESGWDCVCGAGRNGLMRAVSDGVLDAGGAVTGIIPKFMVDNGWDYDRLTETIITPDMHTRKESMAEIADAFIALPGGCGTIEELMEIYTWRQLGIVEKPIVVLNTIGYYDPLLKMVERCSTLGFIKQSHRCLWKIAATPKEAIASVERQLEKGILPVESKY